MVALRTRPRGAVVAPFGLCTFAFALLPVPIGTQDLAALFSYQAVAAQPSPVRVSPFGTIHLATYSFPQPVGSAIPQPSGYRLASLDPRLLTDVTGALSRASDFALSPELVWREFPKVDRKLKGDSLLVPARLPVVAIAPPPGALTREQHAAHTPAADPSNAAEAAAPPSGGVAAEPPSEDNAWSELGPAESAPSDNPTMDTARSYLGDATESKRDAPDRPAASVPLPAPRPDDGGQTIAGKGEVTGQDKQPMSLAKRLGLNAKARAKAEKCLANAIYFEARGESVRGQIAVAQVVMNRVFSEFYPDNVCDVVYQNAHRHNACQFTFACDGIREVVTEPDAWLRAKRIAKDTIEGTLWLDNVGKATHYHAYWVRPWWIGTMRKLHKIGEHTFYRPKRWGDGSDEPAWGSAKRTAEAVKKL